jgi:hypothetical protein
MNVILGLVDECDRRVTIGKAKSQELGAPVQSNPLPICTRPWVLIKGKRT